jgi:hypothetical protein
LVRVEPHLLLGVTLEVRLCGQYRSKPTLVFHDVLLV